MNKLFVFVLAGLILVSCTEDKEDSEQIVLSYHMECAGTQVFSKETQGDVCSSLISEDKNLDCDRDFRKTLFENLCPGKNFPHKVSVPRDSVVSSYYEFSENGCNTGRHYFFYISGRRFNKEVCLSLKDEKLNNYCAEDKRMERYRRDCI